MSGRRHEPVTQRLGATLLQGNAASHYAHVDLRWIPQDPYAVAMLFVCGRFPSPWGVGRDLLIAGLEGPVGELDIQVFPSLSHVRSVEIVLASPGRIPPTAFRVSRAQLRDFLTRTTARIPQGEETVLWPKRVLL